MDTRLAPPPTDAPGSPPAPDGPLSRAAVEAWLGGICFRTGPPGRVGVELELLVAATQGLGSRVSRRSLTRLAADLSGVMCHGRLTQEPGGQVELSSFPAAGLGQVLRATGEDLAAARVVARGAGVRLVGVGVDPLRGPVRILDAPRYAAMEAHFDAGGPLGRVMMASTASLQVNVEAAGAGGDGQARRRWWLLHVVGPALVAAFANSPLRDGRTTGWKSTRQQVWAGIDRARTAPIATGADQDPREAFIRYALAAPVMLVRRPGAGWSAPAGLTFGDWIDGGGAAAGLRPPAPDDLAYHLTTLFPPVRPRGFLEVRYLDAQSRRWWRTAAATLWALAEDERAGDEATAAAEPVSRRWAEAARSATSDPQLRRAAVGCLTAARDGLLRLGEPGPAHELEDFVDAYTARGRCPADDLLDDLPALGRPAALDALEVLP